MILEKEQVNMVNIQNISWHLIHNSKCTVLHTFWENKEETQRELQVPLQEIHKTIPK